MSQKFMLSKYVLFSFQISHICEVFYTNIIFFICQGFLEYFFHFLEILFSLAKAGLEYMISFIISLNKAKHIILLKIKLEKTVNFIKPLDFYQFSS